jgi:hypothetical protein
MNDNPVVLAETHIRLNISESTAVGSELLRINATDKDIGINGKVKTRFFCSKRFIYFPLDSLFN